MLLEYLTTALCPRTATVFGFWSQCETVADRTMWTPSFSLPRRTPDVSQKRLSGENLMLAAQWLANAVESLRVGEEEHITSEDVPHKVAASLARWNTEV